MTPLEVPDKLVFMHEDHAETVRDIAGEPRPHHAGHDHHHGSELSEVELRVRALETVLVQKGLVDPAALDAIVETYEATVSYTHLTLPTICSV